MVQTADINIDIQAINKTHFYHSISANRTILGEKIIQFAHDKVFGLTLIEKNEDNFVFDYQLANHKMVGSGLIHEWASDMEYLQEHLIIKTDKKGSFVEILNFEEVQQKWDKQFIKNLKKKYSSHKEGAKMLIEQTSLLMENPLRFQESFKGYNILRSFFQGYLGEHENVEESKLNLKGYFGQIDLPLIIRSEYLTEDTPETACRIFSTAKLDRRAFKRHEFARMLKVVTDIFDVDATLTIDMEEQYRFTPDYFLKDAELFLQTYVNNWYAITNSHELRLIDQSEIGKII